MIIYERDGNEYWVYYDLGLLFFLRREDFLFVMEVYKWNFFLVVFWLVYMGLFMDEIWDILFVLIGNLGFLLMILDEYKVFYDFFVGGDNSCGYVINLYIGLFYEF